MHTEAVEYFFKSELSYWQFCSSSCSHLELPYDLVHVLIQCLFDILDQGEVDIFIVCIVPMHEKQRTIRIRRAHNGLGHGVL